MRLTITLQLSNAASFESDSELPKILVELVRKLQTKWMHVALHDSNGNKVGEAKFKR